MEVSSKGAGLPLVALGVAALALAATRAGGADDGAPPEDPLPATSTAADTTAVPTSAGGAVPECLTALAIEVEPDRVATVEVGMGGLAVVSPPQPLDLPVALLLTENGALIGAVRLRVYRGTDASSNLLKIEEALDATCEPAPLRNTTRGGDPRNLPNWDTLRLRLGEVDYDLRLGAEQHVEVGSFARAS
jgi:hypothetical protein